MESKKSFNLRLKEPIFILGSHKSGTTLVRNLLDGHPNLFTLPFESHIFEALGRPIEVNYRAQSPQRRNYTEVLTIFLKNLSSYIGSKDPYSDAVLDENLSLTTLERLLQQKELKDESEIISTFFQETAAWLIGNDLPSGTRIVEKSVEHSEFAPELKKRFPDSKFIHIVRNPYSNFLSLRRFKQKQNEFPLMTRIALTLDSSYRNASKNSAFIDDYLIIKYEDLLSQPGETIRTISEFLNIPLTDSLYTPTTLGNPWNGNSTTDKKFTGINKDNMDSWKQNISPLEVTIVNKKLGPYLGLFGYEKMQTPKGKLTPIKGEGFKRYVFNRLAPYFLKY